jgi:hypothetical protein
MPVFDREWKIKRQQIYMYANIWQSCSLNGSKVICMPVFHSELDIKRQQSYLYACIWQ